MRKAWGTGYAHIKMGFRAVQRPLCTMISQRVHVNASRNMEKPSQHLLLTHSDSVTIPAI